MVALRDQCSDDDHCDTGEQRHDRFEKPWTSAGRRT
jgi:hypothetical protein